MNRSSKFNFFLPQNTDPIDVSDFNSNFETIDANLLTKAQSLTEAQKAAVRANVDLNVANNLTTTAAGSVLDARQGKVLNDKFTQTISSLSALNSLISTLAGGERTMALLYSDVTSALVNRSASSVAIITRMDTSVADILLFSLGGNYVGAVRYSTSSSEITKAINLYDAGGFTSYTPSITAGSGFAVSNVAFNYKRQGQMLFVTGRFNITNMGESQKTIAISLPSGMTAYPSGAGSCGSVQVNYNYSGSGLSIRCDGGATVYIQAGAGGYSTTVMSTGYVILNFTCFIQ